MFSCHVDLYNLGGGQAAPANIAPSSQPAPMLSEHHYMWVLSSKQKEVMNSAWTEDTKLADPALKIIPFNNKRKHPDALDDFMTSLEPQRLWQKYGCKVVSTLQSSGKVQARRSYYKCYTKDCTARLTVDCEPASGKQLKVTTSGTHARAC